MDYNANSSALILKPPVEALEHIKIAGNLIRPNEFTSIHQNQNYFTLISIHFEEGESRLWNNLQGVFFGRTRDIVNELRSPMPEEASEKSRF